MMKVQTAAISLVFSGRELAFTFVICYRRSVCLSVVCVSVTLMHITQPVEIFGFRKFQPAKWPLLCVILPNLAVMSNFVLLLVLALSGIGFDLCLDLYGLV